MVSFQSCSCVLCPPHTFVGTMDTCVNYNQQRYSVYIINEPLINTINKWPAFRQSFHEPNTLDGGIMYGATGWLLVFWSSCEFERVKTAGYRSHSSRSLPHCPKIQHAGNKFDSVAMGTQLTTTLIGTTLQITGATENTGKCLAIGRRSESTTDLIVVDCNVPAPSVHDLDTNGG